MTSSATNLALAAQFLAYVEAVEMYRDAARHAVAVRRRTCSNACGYARDGRARSGFNARFFSAPARGTAPRGKPR